MKLHQPPIQKEMIGNENSELNRRRMLSEFFIAYSTDHITYFDYYDVGKPKKGSLVQTLTNKKRRKW